MNITSTKTELKIVIPDLQRKKSCIISSFNDL